MCLIIALMILSSLVFWSWTIVIFVVLTLLRWFLRRHWGSVNRSNEINISGKTVLITGASAGIGKSAAFEFADRDARVILACRNLKKAQDAVKWIRKQTSRGELVCMELDLASLQSVREFCKDFNAKYDKLDILVNNAGVLFLGEKRSHTQDGFETHMGVNHLGHFLLTNLLLEPLKNAAPSRVVTVSSLAHSAGVIDFDDLMYEKHKQGAFAALYSNSKLANALFSKELAKRLEGSGVNCYALCPGMVRTEIGRNVEGALAWIIWLLTPISLYVTTKTSAEGAATIMYCALSKDVSNKSGDMYQHCGHWDEKSRIVLQDEQAERLWTESAKLVGL